MSFRGSVRRLTTASLAFAVSLGPLASEVQAACSTPKNDLFLNPYNKNSAHHRPIGSGASYASDSHSSTRDWLKAGHLNVNAGAPWGTSVAETDTSDPLRVIGARATCDKVLGLPVSIRIPREGFQIPIQNNHSGCPDGVVVFFDRTINKPHQLRQYNWNGGRPTAGQYKTWDIRGLGHGTRSGERMGTSASGVAGLFGVLRGAEINAAGHKIEHALRMGLPRKPGCKIMLSRSVVLPATTGDRNRSTSGYNTGSIPYGGLMALPPSVNIAGMGLSEPGRRLAQAVQDYGVYALDGGGCSAGALEADQHVNGGVKDQLRNDIRKIYPRMRLVLNNNVLGSSTAGGGAPRGDNCAFTPERHGLPADRPERLDRLAPTPGAIRARRPLPRPSSRRHSRGLEPGCPT